MFVFSACRSVYLGLNSIEPRVS